MTLASETRVDEIADGIYRIHTPVRFEDGTAFSFNQYLIRDEEPLLFHTGLRRLFPQVREAVGRVLPVETLRHIAFSHVEADECGALNDWLLAAPQSTPVCSRIAAMVSIADLADRPPRALAEGEALRIGHHILRWFDTPHLPHAWECGYLMEETTATLLCGDLFTQPGGAELPALTRGDILGPSEAFRQALDYYAHAPQSRSLLEKLASQQPRTLACMHGSAWTGDGAALLRALADRLGA